MDIPYKRRTIYLWITVGIILLAVIFSFSEKDNAKSTPQGQAPVERSAAGDRAPHAASLKGGYIACITKEYFDEITQAVVRNDRRGFDFLIDQRVCIVTKPGIPISILDTTWTGTAKVRAYVENQAIVIWTNTENIEY